MSIQAKKNKLNMLIFGLHLIYVNKTTYGNCVLSSSGFPFAVAGIYTYYSSFKGDNWVLGSQANWLRSSDNLSLLKIPRHSRKFYEHLFSVQATEMWSWYSGLEIYKHLKKS